MYQEAPESQRDGGRGGSCWSKCEKGLRGAERRVICAPLSSAGGQESTRGHGDMIARGTRGVPTDWTSLPAATADCAISRSHSQGRVLSELTCRQQRGGTIFPEGRGLLLPER